MLLHLVVVVGDVKSAARAIPIFEGKVFTIGHSPGSDIRVIDTSVARRQCDIEIRGGTAWLLDYGITRGTSFGRSVSVNGQAVNSLENFWPQKPREPPEGTTQDYLDRVNEFMQKQYEMLKWHRLQCGDEIRVGAAVFRLGAPVRTEVLSHGDVTLVTIASQALESINEFDYPSPAVNAMREEFGKIATAITGGLAIDVRDTKHLNHASVDFLFKMARFLADRGIPRAICCSAEVKDVLDLCGVARLIPTSTDLGTAVAHAAPDQK